MIYTVTLNPTLDITYMVENLTLEGTVTASEVIKTPGGKGINVSRALMAMGVESVCMGLFGGYTGEEMLHLLQQEALILQVVKTEAETRTNVIIYDRRSGDELMLKAEGRPVERERAARICDLIMEKAVAPQVMVVSGSLPPGVGPEVYSDLVKHGKEAGTTMVVDTSGRALQSALRAVPYMIKPNLAELEQLAGRELSGDKKVLGFAREIVGGGVEMVVASLGRRGALLVTADEALRGKVPEINEETVGAGDSMVAGLVVGLTRSLPLEETFRTGLAYSVSAVMHHGPGLTEPDTYRQALRMVKVERL